MRAEPPRWRSSGSDDRRARRCRPRPPARSPGRRAPRCARRTGAPSGRPRPRCRAASGRRDARRAAIFSPSPTAQSGGDAGPAAGAAQASDEEGGHTRVASSNDLPHAATGAAVPHGCVAHRGRGGPARARCPRTKRERGGERERDRHVGHDRAPARPAGAVNANGMHSRPTRPVARLRKRKTSAVGSCRRSTSAATSTGVSSRRKSVLAGGASARAAPPARARSGRRRPPRRARP